jgi:hypothetical protein
MVGIADQDGLMFPCPEGDKHRFGQHLNEVFHSTVLGTSITIGNSMQSLLGRMCIYLCLKEAIRMFEQGNDP